MLVLRQLLVVLQGPNDLLVLHTLFISPSCLANNIPMPTQEKRWDTLN